MAHKVKCYYCGSIFDRDKEPNDLVPGKGRRYAHQLCLDRAQQAEQSDIEYQEKLDAYIKELFGYKSVPEDVKKQIRQYVSEYNYTYSGIYKTLRYHYEIKHGSKEKAHGRIGIVPYIYSEANNYYYSLWLAQQKNEAIKLEEYIFPVKEVHIPLPERKPMKKIRKLFTFLDESEGGVE